MGGRIALRQIGRKCTYNSEMYPHVRRRQTRLFSSQRHEPATAAVASVGEAESDGVAVDLRCCCRLAVASSGHCTLLSCLTGIGAWIEGLKNEGRRDMRGSHVPRHGQTRDFQHDRPVGFDSIDAPLPKLVHPETDPCSAYCSSCCASAAPRAAHRRSA